MYIYCKLTLLGQYPHQRQTLNNRLFYQETNITDRMSSLCKVSYFVYEWKMLLLLLLFIVDKHLHVAIWLILRHATQI